MLIRHTLWLLCWLSADKIMLLLECVARYLNANLDVGTITRIAHGIITDCLLFDPMQVVLLYVGGGCCWSLIFICKVGFYVSVSVERGK